MFKNINILLAATAASLSGRIFGAANIERHIQKQKRNHARGAETSIAKLNRHTGNPHEHQREIARRQRQSAARG